jgi:hypothetical protein
MPLRTGCGQPPTGVMAGQGQGFQLTHFSAYLAFLLAS